MTEAEFLDDAIKAAQGAMLVGVPLLSAINPVAGETAMAGVRLLYEELVTARDKLLTETSEEAKAELRQKIIDAAQNYAALRFGAMPPTEG